MEFSTFLFILRFLRLGFIVSTCPSSSAANFGPLLLPSTNTRSWKIIFPLRFFCCSWITIFVQEHLRPSYICLVILPSILILRKLWIGNYDRGETKILIENFPLVILLFSSGFDLIICVYPSALQYWVSQGNKWCEFCKIFITNNPLSIRTHDLGTKHKECVAKRLSAMRKESAAKEKEQKDAVKALAQIESVSF